MPAKRIFYGWWIVTASALALSMSVGPLFVYSFSLFVKPLGAEFGWTRGRVSVAITLTNLSVALISPLVGRLMDRWGSRTVMLFGHTGLAAAGMLLSFLTAPVGRLYVLYAGCGILASGCSPVPYGRLVARWFAHRRGLALGIVMAGVGLGSFAAPFLLQTVIASYGWRAAYQTIAILAVAVPVPLILLVLRENPAQPERLVEERGITCGEALREGVYWRMTAVFFVVAACSNAVVAHLSPLVSDAGMTPAQAAVAVSLFGASALVGRIATGWLVDRFFAGHVAAILFLGLAAGMILLAMATLPYVAATLVGLGLGAEVDVMPYLISRYFGFRSFGAIYGLTFSAFTLGMAAGPVLMGFGFDQAGSYRTVLMALTVFLAGAAAATWSLPRYSVASPTLPL